MQAKQQWQNLAERVDAMSLRERALIFLAAALVLVTLLNTLLINPQLTRQQAISKNLVQTQTVTNALQTQVQALVRSRSADPDAPLRERMAKLQAESAEADSALQEIQSGLIAPQQMPALLDDILQRHRGLRLVSLKTLPVENLAAPDAKAASAGETEKPAPAPTGAASVPAVYRHGVEIAVQGGYLDLLRYLAAMEASPWRMFWGKADLNVDAYPKATLTLRLHTLSLDKAWLAI